jgi:hypothetical protein
MYYYKRRNYRIVHAFMAGGLGKGVQTGLIGVVWCVTDWAVSGVLEGNGVVRGAVKGGVCGSLMGLAGRGHRAYYAWRGIRLGTGCGLVMGLVEHLLASSKKV